MNFSLTDEQTMLEDSAARFLEQYCDFEASRRRLADPDADPAALWSRVAEQGWLGAGLPEAAGGFGGGPVETALLAQQFGRALLADPWLGCGVLAIHTLEASGGDSDLLGRLIDGSTRAALAYSEAGSRGDPSIVETRAEAAGGDWLLSGEKTLVLGAPGADYLIVSARVDGAVDAPQGIALFLVAADAAGLAVDPVTLHDGSSAANVRLSRVRAAKRLADGDSGLDALYEGFDRGIAAQCAGLVGAMERAIGMTADYLQTRQQFGVALASFQSLQHRLADMATELEFARSMLFVALSVLENDSIAARRADISAAKMVVVTAARMVCGQAIQLHGGIGMTEEHAIGHYFKYVVVCDVLLGSRTLHEAICAATLDESLTDAA